MAQYSPSFNRSPKGKFNADNSFVSVVAGTDGYLLEDEFNEMQWIQAEARASLFRRITQSGFLTAAPFEFPILSNQYAPNTFMIKADQAIWVNMYGYEMRVGDNDVNNRTLSTPVVADNQVLIELPTPPTTGTRTDLVFLEAWFQIVSGQSPLHNYGGQDDPEIPNLITDPRVNVATTERVQLAWRIRTIAGATNISDDNIFALNASGESAGNSYAYTLSSDDAGVYVAGKGDLSIQDLGTIDGYVYALPVCTVERLNTAPYDAKLNPNGAWQYTYSSVAISAQAGDTTLSLVSTVGFSNGQEVQVGPNNYTIVGQPSSTAINITPGLVADVAPGAEVSTANSGRPDNMFNNMIYNSQVTEKRFYTRPSTVTAQDNSVVQRDDLGGMWGNFFNITPGNYVTASGSSLVLHTASGSLLMQFDDVDYSLSFLHDTENGTIGTTYGDLRLTSDTNKVTFAGSDFELHNPLTSGTISMSMNGNNVLTYSDQLNDGVLYINTIPFGSKPVAANSSGTYVSGPIELAGELTVDAESTFVGDVTINGALNVTDIQGVRGLVTTSEVGAPDGVAPLDSNGYVAEDNIIADGVVEGQDLLGIAHFESSVLSTRGHEGTFARDTIAYDTDTLLPVKADEPRLVNGHLGKGILIEESSEQLLLNSDIEVFTNVSTLFTDQLQFSTAWTIQTGKVSFANAGATFSSYGWISTNPKITWSPLIGSDGSSLKLSGATTLRTKDVTSRLSLYFAQDNYNYYLLEVNSNNSEEVVLSKVVGGTVTPLASGAYTTTADTNYTLQLVLDTEGNLNAEVYLGYSANGTPVTTLSAIDNTLKGPFMFGLGGDSGVLATEAAVNAATPNMWSFASLGNENYGSLSTFAKSGSHSIHFLGTASGYFNQRYNGLVANQMYTISAYIYVVSGSAVLQVSNDSNNSALGGFLEVPANGKWVRVMQTFTADSTGIADVMFSSSQYPCEFYLDAIQLEEKSYATSYIRNDSVASGTAVTRGADNLYFDGSLLSPTTGTVSLWVEPYADWQNGVAPDYQDEFWLLGNDKKGTSDEFRLAWNKNTGSFEFGIGTSTPDTYQFTPPVSQFTHVSLSWDTEAGTSNLYINGLPAASGTANTFTSNYVYVGRDMNSHYYVDGVIDELMFFSEVLPAKEVNRITNAPTPVVDAYQSDAATLQGTALSQLVQVSQDNVAPFYAANTGALLVDWYALDTDTPPGAYNSNAYGKLIKRETISDLNLVNYAPNGVTENYYGRIYGYITAPTTDIYTFSVTSDDGARLYIDGAELINNWVNENSVTKSVNISLTAGYTYPILIEYFQGGGSSALKLEYGNSTISDQVVPSSQLSWSDPWYSGFEVLDNVIIHDSLTAENDITVNGSTTTNNLTVEQDAEVKGNLTVDETLAVTGSGTHNIAGQLELDGSQPILRIKDNGVMGAPGSNNNDGFRVVTWDNDNYDFGIGVDNNTQWYSTDQYHRWYDSSRTKQMELDNANLWINGTITSNAGTSSFDTISASEIEVTPFANNAFLIGNSSDVGSTGYSKVNVPGFAAAIAVPSTKPSWPFAITTAGTPMVMIDPSGSMYFNNGFNLISPSGTHNMLVDNYGNTTIYGDFTVLGTMTTVDSNNYTLGTQWIDLNESETGTPTQPAGLRIHRGTATTVVLEWDEAKKRWSATDSAGNYWPVIVDNGSVTFTNHVGMISLNVADYGLFGGNVSVSGNLTASGTLVVGGTSASSETDNHYIYGTTYIGDTTNGFTRFTSTSSGQYLESSSSKLNLTGNTGSQGNEVNVNFNTVNLNGTTNINGNTYIGSAGSNQITYAQDIHIQATETATSSSSNHSSRFLYFDGSSWNGSTAITEGFVLVAGDTGNSAPTDFYLKANNNGTLTDVMWVSNAGSITATGPQLILGNGNTTYGTSSNTALVSNSTGVMTVGYSWDWDNSGGFKANSSTLTLDIGTADQLGAKNASNTLTGGIRLMNDTTVEGTFTVNSSNNPITLNVNPLWIGQSAAGGAFVSVSNSNSTNYIESYNNTQNGNADLHITGYNGNQGSNLYLNFVNIYNDGSTYLKDAVIQDGNYLFFGTNTSTSTGADNTDPVYIYRTNDASDSTGLHVVVGDNGSEQPSFLGGSAGDYFTVETTNEAKLFVVTSAGDGYIDHDMSVGGTLFIGDPTTALGSHAALSMSTSNGTAYLNINPNGNYDQVNVNSSLSVQGGLINFGATSNTSNWINIQQASGTGSYGLEFNDKAVLAIIPTWSSDTLFLNTTPTVEGEGPTYADGVQTLSHFGVLGGNINVQQIDVPSNLTAVADASGTAGSQLAGSTTYYYAVTATTTDGETPISNVTSANTATTPHPVALNWTGVQGASGYNIYRGTSSNALYLMDNVGIVNTYSDDGNKTPNSSVTPPTINTTGGSIAVNGLTLGAVVSEPGSSRINASGYIDLKPGSQSANLGLVVRSSVDSNFTTIATDDAYSNMAFVGYNQSTNGLTLDNNGNTHIIGGKLTVDNGIYVNAGDVQVKGKYVEVHRRPLFGWASSAGAYNTNSADYNGPDNILYYPFGVGSGGLPQIPSGATRYYRLYAVWSDNIESNNTQQLYPYVALSNYTTGSGTMCEWQMNYTWGDPTNGSRDGWSPYFQVTPTEDTASIEIMINDAAKSLTGTAPQSASFTLFSLYLIAYDQF